MVTRINLIAMFVVLACGLAIPLGMAPIDGLHVVYAQQPASAEPAGSAVEGSKQPGAERPSPTAQEEYQVLEEEFRQAQRLFKEALDAAKTEDQRRKIVEELGPKTDPKAYTKRFLRIIADHPSSTVALDAFNWLLAYSSTDANKAVGSISPELIRSPQIVSVCRALRYRQCEAGMRILQEIIRTNPLHNVQGYAKYSLAKYYRKKADGQTGPASDRSLSEGAAAMLLKEVVADYGHLELNGGTLGKTASQDLFELTHLGIGKTAPEIEGQAIDGRPLKLSDYRGKVVLLVFSGFSWCAACRVSLAHEKELVKRLEDQPFVLVAVYREGDLNWLKDFMAKEGIPWRAWWEDPAAEQLVSEKWNVFGWPALYLLDAQGIVRYKGDVLRGITLKSDGKGGHQPVHTLDEAVDKLLQEMSKRK